MPLEAAAVISFSLLLNTISVLLHSLLNWIAYTLTLLVKCTIVQTRTTQHVSTWRSSCRQWWFRCATGCARTPVSRVARWLLCGAPLPHATLGAMDVNNSRIAVAGFTLPHNCFQYFHLLSVVPYRSDYTLLLLFGHKALFDTLKILQAL